MAESRKNRILIVDDDVFLLEIYSLKFKEQGFDVDLAKSGEEALDKIKNGNIYDVLLLDVVMPGIDGFEVLKRIEKEKKVTKSLLAVLTNLGQKEDIEKGKKLGVDAYIIKAQFSPLEVVNKIKKLLDDANKK